MTLSSRTNIDNICFEQDTPPQLVMLVKDKKFGLLGYLVIDSLASDKCFGGIRMAHDISLNEVVQLARAMTLKFAFSNSPTGGAKAGIICPVDANHKEKKEILKAFGRNLGPIFRLYGPGGDLGIGPKELDIIKRAAGMATKMTPSKYKAGFFAAYGVFVSAKTVMRELGLKFNDCTFAIEGYGNVGRPLAKLLYQEGSKIVAISTIDGAIFNKNGLDIDRLEALAIRYGDKVVKVYKHAKKIEKSDLFTLDVNLIIPGARSGSINIDNVYEVKANAIVPAANIPVTKEASEVLYRRRITYIPDFVSTSGTTIGASLVDRGFKEKDVLDIMDKTFQVKISKLIRLSNHNDMNIEQLALKIACSNFVRLRNDVTLRQNRAKWFIAKIKEEKSIVPVLERLACRLYTTFHGGHFFLKDILRPLAIANVYRNALGDVKNYPTLTVVDSKNKAKSS
jgi:glutamate dehydrogenase (NAD(P)+)